MGFSPLSEKFIGIKKARFGFPNRAS